MYKKGNGCEKSIAKAEEIETLKQSYLEKLPLNNFKNPSAGNKKRSSFLKRFFMLSNFISYLSQLRTLNCSLLLSATNQLNPVPADYTEFSR